MRAPIGLPTAAACRSCFGQLCDGAVGQTTHHRRHIGDEAVGPFARDAQRTTPSFAKLRERERRSEAHPPRTVAKRETQLRHRVGGADRTESTRRLRAYAPIAVA